MNRWVKRGIIAAVIVGLVAGGVVASRNAKQKQAEEPKFRTQAIDRGAITQVVLASGNLQPVTSVNIGTQVSGTVSERLVDFNDRVKKGQVLLRIDPTTIQARIRQANAQLASAQASLTLARSTHERNTRLQTQGFVSGVVAEQSKRELDVAITNVEVAKAQLDSSQNDLNNSVVRSPIDGVVIKRNTDVGQTVAASFQTPDLFQIAQDLKRMQIHSNVSEADVGLIKNGQEARFAVDAYPDREFSGKVEQFRLNPTNTSGVVTYNIIVWCASPRPRCAFARKMMRSRRSLPINRRLRRKPMHRKTRKARQANQRPPRLLQIQKTTASLSPLAVVRVCSACTRSRPATCRSNMTSPSAFRIRGLRKWSAAT
jgi:HlyD family secretion protein